MSPNRFWQERMAEVYAETDDERLYRFAWAVYHYQTEEFDRRLPHRISERSGDALPEPGWPQRESQRYAQGRRRVHARWTDLLRRRLGRDRVFQIRQGFARLSHEDLRRMVYEEPQGEDAEWVQLLLRADE